MIPPPNDASSISKQLGPDLRQIGMVRDLHEAGNTGPAGQTGQVQIDRCTSVTNRCMRMRYCACIPWAYACSTCIRRGVLPELLRLRNVPPARVAPGLIGSTGLLRESL